MSDCTVLSCILKFVLFFSVFRFEKGTSAVELEGFACLSVPFYSFIHSIVITFTDDFFLVWMQKDSVFELCSVGAGFVI